MSLALIEPCIKTKPISNSYFCQTVMKWVVLWALACEVPGLSVGVFALALNMSVVLFQPFIGTKLQKAAPSPVV